MSFMNQALNFGYSVQDILEYLARVNPEFGNRVREALNVGYSVEEIFQNFNSAFKGSQGKKVAKQMGINPRYAKNLVFSGEFDPANLTTEAFQPSEGERQITKGLGRAAALAGGTAAGYALGGPIGSFIGQQLGGLFPGSAESPTPEGPTTPSPQPSPITPTSPQTLPSTQQTPRGESYLSKAIEGLPFASLSKDVRNRILTLGKKLEEFQNKGIPFEDDKVQKVVNRVKSFFTGSPKLIDQEIERFEKAYPPEEPTIIPQPIEKFESSEINQEKKQRLIEKIKQKKGPLEDYLSSIGKIDIPINFPKSKDFKPIQSLKSSNIRYADYDPETKILQTLFLPSEKEKSGKIYEYYDVPLDDIEKFFRGADATTTSGENRIRAWYKGKNPSLGAAFDQFIKRKDEEGKAIYEYREIDTNKVRDKDLLKVREADTVDKVADYLDSFKEIKKGAKRKQRGMGLKQKLAFLKNAGDDIIDALLKEIEDEIQISGKKRFKGGKEAEIERRLEEKFK